MSKRWSLINRTTELLVLGVMAGVLITGCGGGDAEGSVGASATPIADSTTPPDAGGGVVGGGSAAGTAVASFIADSQEQSFLGGWGIGGPSETFAAIAWGITFAPTTTANSYAVTALNKTLAAGVWNMSSFLSSPVFFDLAPAGWVESTYTGTLVVDSGDGSNFTYSNSSGATGGFSVSKTSLEGTAIVCTDPLTSQTVTCTAPGTYPAGATLYTETSTTNSYYLRGSDPATEAVTDATGTPLTAMPAVGTTICVPYDNFVFKPKAGALTGANNYDVFSLPSQAGCTADNITTAITLPTLGTVLISLHETGNAAVPSVLRVTAATSVVPGYLMDWVNRKIIGLRAGHVWEGEINSTGDVYLESNKIAINAEIVANGFTPLP